MVQQDLAASLRDSKEALHREAEIMAQLEAQDQVILPLCTPLSLHTKKRLLLQSHMQASAASGVWIPQYTRVGKGNSMVVSIQALLLVPLVPLVREQLIGADGDISNSPALINLLPAWALYKS